jgi:alpha-beta hydrolase superfamily lysophospholipase
MGRGQGVPGRMFAIARSASVVSVQPRRLADDSESFDVTVVEAARPQRIVLFAVGAGGNPERHAPLLAFLAAAGCAVVAPHFARLASPRPTEAELLLRARRLRIALDAVAAAGVPVAGVGHSIGGTMLVALAGGQIWMRAGVRLSIEPDARLSRLVAFVALPIQVWAGSADDLAGIEHAQLLVDALATRAPVDLRLREGAGHFSFMDAPPPQVTEPLADRDAFLAELRRETLRFVMA